MRVGLCWELFLVSCSSFLVLCEQGAVRDCFEFHVPGSELVREVLCWESFHVPRFTFLVYEGDTLRGIVQGSKLD
jgi:hypothetical protein